MYVFPIVTSRIDCSEKNLGKVCFTTNFYSTHISSMHGYSTLERTMVAMFKAVTQLWQLLTGMSPTTECWWQLPTVVSSQLTRPQLTNVRTSPCPRGKMALIFNDAIFCHEKVARILVKCRLTFCSFLAAGHAIKSTPAAASPVASAERISTSHG